MSTTLAYIVRGSGPGLLLAHGAGSSIEDSFSLVLDDLSRTHTVVGPDYPGSGASPRSVEPLDLDTLADAIVQAATDAGREHFAILGYSMGTAVAVRAANRHPDKVTGLVLTAGMARPDRALLLAADIWGQLLDGDPRVLANYLLRICSGMKQLNRLSAADVAAAVDTVIDHLPVGSADHLALLKTIDVTSDLPRIAVPTLVISPAGDILVDPSLSRELADGIAGAQLIEIDAGHDVVLEETDQWLAAVQEFLADTVSAPDKRTVEPAAGDIAAT